MGLLGRIAEAAAQRLGHSTGVVGQEWTRDFGGLNSDRFRDAIRALRELWARRGGRLRLVCHCAPRKCHTFTIAAYLAVMGDPEPDDVSMAVGAGDIAEISDL